MITLAWRVPTMAPAPSRYVSISRNYKTWLSCRYTMIRNGCMSTDSEQIASPTCPAGHIIIASYLVSLFVAVMVTTRLKEVVIQPQHWWTRHSNTLVTWTSHSLVVATCVYYCGGMSLLIFLKNVVLLSVSGGLRVFICFLFSIMNILIHTSIHITLSAVASAFVSLITISLQMLHILLETHMDTGRPTGRVKLLVSGSVCCSPQQQRYPDGPKACNLTRGRTQDIYIYI